MNDAEKIAQMKAWVRHWIEDVDVGLMPTRDSLQNALDELEEEIPRGWDSLTDWEKDASIESGLAAHTTNFREPSKTDSARDRANFNHFMAIGDDGELLD